MENDPDNPEQRPNMDEWSHEHDMGWKSKTIIVIIILAVVAGLWWWLKPLEWFPSFARKTPVAIQTVDETIDQISRLVVGLTDNMNSNLLRSSDEFRQLVTSNQMVMSQNIDSNQMTMFRRFETFAGEVISNSVAIASIRAEIPGIVEKTVEEKVAKAMEPFQQLLTNPPAAMPPAALVTPTSPLAPVPPQPAPTPQPLVATNPPPPVTALTPPAVTAVINDNRNTTTVISTQAVEKVGVVIYNYNQNSTGANPPPQPTTSPYLKGENWWEWWKRQ